MLFSLERKIQQRNQNFCLVEEMYNLLYAKLKLEAMVCSVERRMAHLLYD